MFKKLSTLEFFSNIKEIQIFDYEIKINILSSLLKFLYFLFKQKKISISNPGPNIGDIPISKRNHMSIY